MGEEEHIKKETGSREVEIPSPPQTISQVNKKSKPCSPPSSPDREYMFPLSSPTKTSVPFVSLEVNGVTCKFLGDSGASVNIVSNVFVIVSKVFSVALER